MGFDSGFGVDFVVGSLARPAATRSKSFVFSYLPVRKVLVLPFAGGVSPPLPVFSLLFSASYPQASRSYYLFFNYMYVLPYMFRKTSLRMLPVSPEN